MTAALIDRSRYRDQSWYDHHISDLLLTLINLSKTLNHEPVAISYEQIFQQMQ